MGSSCSTAADTNPPPERHIERLNGPVRLRTPEAPPFPPRSETGATRVAPRATPAAAVPAATASSPPAWVLTLCCDDDAFIHTVDVPLVDDELLAVAQSRRASRGQPDQNRAAAAAAAAASAVPHSLRRDSLAIGVTRAATANVQAHTKNLLPTQQQQQQRQEGGQKGVKSGRVVHPPDRPPLVVPLRHFGGDPLTAAVDNAPQVTNALPRTRRHHRLHQALSQDGSIERSTEGAVDLLLPHLAAAVSVASSPTAVGTVSPIDRRGGAAVNVGSPRDSSFTVVVDRVSGIDGSGGLFTPPPLPYLSFTAAPAAGPQAQRHHRHNDDAHVTLLPHSVEPQSQSPRLPLPFATPAAAGSDSATTSGYTNNHGETAPVLPVFGRIADGVLNSFNSGEVRAAYPTIMSDRGGGVVGLPLSNVGSHHQSSFPPPHTIMFPHRPLSSAGVSVASARFAIEMVTSGSSHRNGYMQSRSGFALSSPDYSARGGGPFAQQQQQAPSLHGCIQQRSPVNVHGGPASNSDIAAASPGRPQTTAALADPTMIHPTHTKTQPPAVGGGTLLHPSHRGGPSGGLISAASGGLRADGGDASVLFSASIAAAVAAAAAEGASRRHEGGGVAAVAPCDGVGPTRSLTSPIDHCVTATNVAVMTPDGSLRGASLHEGSRGSSHRRNHVVSTSTRSVRHRPRTSTSPESSGGGDGGLVASQPHVRLPLLSPRAQLALARMNRFVAAGESADAVTAAVNVARRNHEQRASSDGSTYGARRDERIRVSTDAIAAITPPCAHPTSLKKCNSDDESPKMAGSPGHSFPPTPTATSATGSGTSSTNSVTCENLGGVPLTTAADKSATGEFLVSAICTAVNEKVEALPSHDGIVQSPLGVASAGIDTRGHTGGEETPLPLRDCVAAAGGGSGAAAALRQRNLLAAAAADRHRHRHRAVSATRGATAAVGGGGTQVVKWNDVTGGIADGDGDGDGDGARTPPRGIPNSAVFLSTWSHSRPPSPPTSEITPTPALSSVGGFLGKQNALSQIGGIGIGKLNPPDDPGPIDSTFFITAPAVVAVAPPMENNRVARPSTTSSAATNNAYHTWTTDDATSAAAAAIVAPPTPPINRRGGGGGGGGASHGTPLQIHTPHRHHPSSISGRVSSSTVVSALNNTATTNVVVSPSSTQLFGGSQSLLTRVTPPHHPRTPSLLLLRPTSFSLARRRAPVNDFIPVRQLGAREETEPAAAAGTDVTAPPRSVAQSVFGGGGGGSGGWLCFRGSSSGSRRCDHPFAYDDGW